MTDQLDVMCAGQSGPAVEVPFDGTIYDLETGKVTLICMQLFKQHHFVVLVYVLWH